MTLEISLGKIVDGMGQRFCGVRHLSVEVEKSKVYRFKIMHDDGGMTFDMESEQSVERFLAMVWLWLSILRDGDGSIDDPRLKIYGPPLPKPDCKYCDSKEYHQAFSKYEKSIKPLLRSQKLKNVGRLEIGCSFRVEYDTGVNRKTSFEIQLVKTYKIIRNDTKFPKVIPSIANKRVVSLYMHQPTPTMVLDDIFLHANNAMFPPNGNRWICPFPSSPCNGGFIGGEFTRYYDVLFMPSKSSSLFEALVVMNHTMKKYPETISYDEKGSNSHCRIALPRNLTKATQSKYNAYMAKKPNAVYDLISNRQFKSVADCKYKLVNRVPESELSKFNMYKEILESMFPKCSFAYGNGRWASYRNGKVITSDGNDKGGQDRGVPEHVYDEVSYNVRSLHEFLCVCEALF
mmetsp:Transcript_63809/g.71323  ORF Transcript_63809/g.71323 Transcript_63809/m.71323 type:complete len:403 (+) Transcript_63809:210-1418(+)